MPNTRYEKGMRLERQARLIYETYGWFVIPSKGSRGVADGVALKYGSLPQLFQCKAGPCGPKTRRLLIETAAKLGVVAIFVTRPKRGQILWISYHPGYDEPEVGEHP